MCSLEASFALLMRFCHAALILVIARLLYPKLRKRGGRLGGKGAPGSARAAVLNYLAALEPSELGPVAELFFAPLSGAFKEPPVDAGEAPSPSDSFAEWRCASFYCKLLAARPRTGLCLEFGIGLGLESGFGIRVRNTVRSRVSLPPQVLCVPCARRARRRVQRSSVQHMRIKRTILLDPVEAAPCMPAFAVLLLELLLIRTTVTLALSNCFAI